MIFVIDGVDASGKTTLAKCMAGKLECAYVHHTYDKTWTDRQLLDHHLRFLFNYNSSSDVVLDRSWPSCQVYGQVFRGNPDEIPIAAIAKIFELLGVTYIYAIPEYEQWAKLYKAMCESRDEMYGDDNRMVDVYDAYANLVQNSISLKKTWYIYDMHKQDMQTFVNTMLG